MKTLQTEMCGERLFATVAAHQFTQTHEKLWKKRLLQSANDKQSKRKIPQTHPDPSTETEGTGTVLLERQRISSYSDKAMFL